VERTEADPRDPRKSDGNGVDPDATSNWTPVRRDDTDTPPTAESGGAESKAWYPGARLDKYRIVRRLGRGASGAVYLAWHETLACHRAIKILHAELARDDHAAARFLREARMLGQLHDPHVAGAIDAGFEDRVAYLVMEFVDGVTLKEMVRREGPIPPDRAIPILRQVGLGLDGAHRKKIVHRDVKPGNLMIDSEGRVKILDLGIAHLASAQGVEELTHAGVMMGTADYVAPEQAQDARAADARSDLYGLGCTLFFMLTGRTPYSDVEGLLPKIRAHESSPVADFPSGHACDPRGPFAELGRIARKLMAKRPEDRYASAAELLDALEQAFPTRSRETASPAPIGNTARWIVGLSIAAVLTAVALTGPRWSITDRSTDADRRSAADSPEPVSASPKTDAGGAARAELVPGLIEWKVVAIPDGNTATRPVEYPCIRAGNSVEPAREPALGREALVKFVGRLEHPAAWTVIWIDTRGEPTPIGTDTANGVDLLIPPGDDFSRVNAADPPGDHLIILALVPSEGDADALLNALRGGAAGAARDLPSSEPSEPAPICRRVDSRLGESLRLQMAPSGCLLIDAFLLRVPR